MDLNYNKTDGDGEEKQRTNYIRIKIRKNNKSLHLQKTLFILHFPSRLAMVERHFKGGYLFLEVYGFFL